MSVNMDKGMAVIRPVSQAPASTQTDAMAMIQVAVERGADVASLEKLIDLQERMQATDARRQYVAAMAAARADLPATVYKTKSVAAGPLKYSHAELGDICQIARAALSRHGLDWCWSIDQPQSAVRVTCSVTHEAGHSESVSLTAPVDGGRGRNDIQAIGSTVTYLERYTLKAALGIAEHGQDDDGARGSISATEAQIARLLALADDERVSEGGRAKIHGALSGGRITAARAGALIGKAKAAIEAKSEDKYAEPVRDPGEEG